jgi:hypothetical protein
MLEDYSQQQPIATWNPARGVWETMQVNLLCGHSEPWLETWPTSGIAVNGSVYELPMQVHPITVSESSLLRSPTASQGEGGALGEETARARGNTVGIRDNALDIAKLNGLPVSRVVDNLMPTPNTMDHLPARTPEQKLANKGKGGYANVRETVVNDLIPTPMSRDYKGDTSPHERNGVIQTDTVERAIFHSGEVLLGTPRTSTANGSSASQVEQGAPKARIEDQVHITSWGKFEPAIRRWEEVLDRPAPAPTKPDGKDGAHRLSSGFTEWMMGLPEGWITDVGLSRNEELKACGNGVVPQQAEMALRFLLQGVLEVTE